MPAFHCSKCNGKMRVVDSRATGAVDGSCAIRRRRECVKCEIRITTYETVIDATDTIRIKGVMQTRLRNLLIELQKGLKVLADKPT